jgi:hypothetical protein
MSEGDKVRYKDDYEKFKFILNVIGLFMSILNLLVNYRALELAFMFLLVWYYCTLTIRESILKVTLGKCTLEFMMIIKYNLMII